MRLDPTEGADDWFWCLDHQRAESAEHSCPAMMRFGPYESKASAEHWQERVELRNKARDRDDAVWDAPPGEAFGRG